MLICAYAGWKLKRYSLHFSIEWIILEARTEMFCPLIYFHAQHLKKQSLVICYWHSCKCVCVKSVEQFSWLWVSSSACWVDKLFRKRAFANTLVRLNSCPPVWLSLFKYVHLCCKETCRTATRHILRRAAWVSAASATTLSRHWIFWTHSISFWHRSID